MECLQFVQRPKVKVDILQSCFLNVALHKINSLCILEFTGLMDISHGMASPANIVPFLPGHIEVFDLKPNGKVQSIEMEQFHCCTQEPAHAIYDTVERVPTSKKLFFYTVYLSKLQCCENVICFSSSIQKVKPIYRFSTHRAFISFDYGDYCLPLIKKSYKTSWHIDTLNHKC